MPTRTKKNEVYFNLRDCPRTKSGVCEEDGKTITVDPTIVPLKSTIDIDTLGRRQASDTGGSDVKGHRIDVFMGYQHDACIKDFGRIKNVPVTFIQY